MKYCHERQHDYDNHMREAHGWSQLQVEQALERAKRFMEEPILTGAHGPAQLKITWETNLKTLKGILGPEIKKTRRVSDATIMKYVKMARERGLI